MGPFIPGRSDYVLTTEDKQFGDEIEQRKGRMLVTKYRETGRRRTPSTDPFFRVYSNGLFHAGIPDAPEMETKMQIGMFNIFLL